VLNLRRARDVPAIPTYDELVLQNRQLRKQTGNTEILPKTRLEASQVLQPSSRLYSDAWAHDLLQPTSDEHGLSSGSTVTSVTDIFIPDRDTSRQLVEYDKTWHSWVHYATEYPRFRTEHDVFMDNYEKNRSLADFDMSWSAVYLSVICVSQASLKRCHACRHA